MLTKQFEDFLANSYNYKLSSNCEGAKQNDKIRIIVSNTQIWLLESKCSWSKVILISGAHFTIITFCSTLSIQMNGA
jgi:hypothetical protein